jgi:hypothetical protein
VKIITSGAIELIGPDVVPLMGGMAGCYIRTRGKTGWGTLEVSADGMKPVLINFRGKQK